PAGQTKAQLLTAIERGLHATARSGRRTLLIVDEAQALPVSALEELRMLSNFQAGGHALLQIFLLGQPEFRQRLHGSDRLEQLRQRVIAMHHLDPMGPEEVEPYMVHRLSVVGWQGRPSFTPEAFQALYRGSGGVPRVLNQLAGRVLLFGAIDQLETINGDVVDAVIADIAGDSPLPRPINRAKAEPVQAVEAVEAPEPVKVPEQMEAPKPIPIVSASPLPVEPRPIRFSPELEPAPEILPAAAPEAVSKPEAAAQIPDQQLIDRIAALEERIEEQEAALRRVLTLLVDWVEGEGSPDIASVRHAAGR
ncbi:AAA family ATPase, partial [Sphingomonas sp.]|uniref:ExeA family protein n=1 Tax=Sphingomonas sp. TaxID=28214 RepID=UPI003D6D3890